jgi:hypothetical protein
LSHYFVVSVDGINEGEDRWLCREREEGKEERRQV